MVENLQLMDRTIRCYQKDMLALLKRLLHEIFKLFIAEQIITSGKHIRLETGNFAHTKDTYDRKHPNDTHGPDT